MKFDEHKTVLAACAAAVALIAWFAPRPGAQDSSGAPASRGAATATLKTTAPAVPPPNPYRYGGRLTQQGETQVLLAKGTAGNLTVAARPGAVLDGTYRIDEVTPTTVVMTYLPLSLRQVVPIDPPEAAAPLSTAVSSGARSGETRLPPPISGLSSSVPSSVPAERP